jgi:hypothetical protein
MAKRPDDRWSGAEEFRAALAGAIPLPPQGYLAVAAMPSAPVPHFRASPAAPIRNGDRDGMPPSFDEFWQPEPPSPGLSRRELRRWSKTQTRQRKRALRDYRRLQIQWHAASLEKALNRGDSYDDKPLIDRVIAFRRSAFRFAVITPLALFLNVGLGGDVPWFLLPAGILLFDCLRRAGSIWSDGVGPLDAFRKGIRVYLATPEVNPLSSAAIYGAQQRTSLARSAATDASRRQPRMEIAALQQPPDHALSALPAEVMIGSYGAAIRRAMDDSRVARGALARLGTLERDMLPDIGATIDALTQRIASLTTTLYRLDADVSGATLESLEQRIEALKTGSTPSGEQQRTLSLLERQRTSLNDLLSRRQALLSQLDSAGLALQNLKLDLLKLHSAGMTAAVEGEGSPTQEARSVSRDIGRIIEVADDLRHL